MVRTKHSHSRKNDSLGQADLQTTNYIDILSHVVPLCLSSKNEIDEYLRIIKKQDARYKLGNAYKFGSIREFNYRYKEYMEYIKTDKELRVMYLQKNIPFFKLLYRLYRKAFKNENKST